MYLLPYPPTADWILPSTYHVRKRLKMGLWALTMEAWRLKWIPGGFVDQWSQTSVSLMRSRIWIRIWIQIKVKVGFRIAIRWKSGSRLAFNCYPSRNPSDCPITSYGGRARPRISSLPFLSSQINFQTAQPERGNGLLEFRLGSTMRFVWYNGTQYTFDSVKLLNLCSWSWLQYSSRLSGAWHSQARRYGSLFPSQLPQGAKTATTDENEA
jgi:hypothetical protein